MSKTCLMCGETYPDSTTFCPRDGSTLRATVIGDDLIGELFCERYVVTDMLGEGGMASVYLARDVRLPQQVAIKVLRDAGATDATLVQRFRQEAEAASRINHDRVARVSDFGFMTDGRAFLVMEYVDGHTLRQVLDERGRLSFAEAANITNMVAEGLNAAHRLGIVHRDLKPENVMVVEDEDGGLRVKVLDFGIAKILESQEGEGRTAPGFVIGTPKWMSPEQLLGMPLDGRSDIYSLALLAFAMLTGERAFDGPSEHAEMMARLSTPARTLIAVRPDVAWPDELQALFARTLVREPEARPATALAFAREFARCVDVPTTTTSMTSIPPRPMPSVPASAGPSPLSALPMSATPMSSTPVSATPISASAVGGASRGTPASPGSTSKPPARTATRAAAIGGLATVAVLAAVMVWKRQSSTAPAASIVTADSSTASSGAAPRDTTASLPPTAVQESPGTTPPAPAVEGAAAARADTTASTATRAPTAPKVAVRTPAAPVSKPPRTDSTVSTASDADASDMLERLISEAEQSIGALDEGAKRTKASELIRQLEALTPRLTSNADRGWAAFYIGTSRATLGDNAKACASLVRAQALATTSKALKSSSEKFLLELNCSGR